MNLAMAIVELKTHVSNDKYIFIIYSPLGHLAQKSLKKLPPFCRRFFKNSTFFHVLIQIQDLFFRVHSNKKWFKLRWTDLLLCFQPIRNQVRKHLLTDVDLTWIFLSNPGLRSFTSLVHFLFVPNIMYLIHRLYWLFLIAIFYLSLCLCDMYIF